MRVRKSRWGKESQGERKKIWYGWETFSPWSFFPQRVALWLHLLLYLVEAIVVNYKKHYSFLHDKSFLKMTKKWIQRKERKDKRKKVKVRERKSRSLKETLSTWAVFSLVREIKFKKSDRISSQMTEKHT